MRDMAKVTFEFDIFEDASELKMYKKIDHMYMALATIYDLVREELKHGDEPLSEHIEKLLEDVKSEAAIIHELQ